MTHPPTESRRRRRMLAALGLVALLGVTVACDDTKNGAAVATLDTGGKSDDDAGDGKKKEPTEQERNDAMLEFASCMREHGIDMPDPQMDADGGVSIAVGAPSASAGGGAPTGPSEAEMQKMDEANDACEPIMEDVMGEPEEMSPEDQAKFRDEQLAYAKCMREHGVDMPDPEIDFEGGRTKINMGGSEQGTPIDPESPTFKTASEACESLLGEGRIAIAGGPGPVGGASTKGNVITSGADGGDK